MATLYLMFTRLFKARSKQLLGLCRQRAFLDVWHLFEVLLSHQTIIEEPHSLADQVFALHDITLRRWVHLSPLQEPDGMHSLATSQILLQNGLSDIILDVHQVDYHLVHDFIFSIYFIVSPLQRCCDEVPLLLENIQFGLARVVSDLESPLDEFDYSHYISYAVGHFLAYGEDIVYD